MSNSTMVNEGLNCLRFRLKVVLTVTLCLTEDVLLHPYLRRETLDGGTLTIDRRTIAR